MDNHSLLYESVNCIPITRRKISDKKAYACPLGMHYKTAKYFPKNLKQCLSDGSIGEDGNIMGQFLKREDLVLIK